MTTIAQGVQLDVIGKYAGVSRTGNGFSSVITLDDAEFLTLIQMAIARNTAGSSLADIVGLLFQNFGNDILVTDHLGMRMSFLISSALGSQDLVQLFITEGLLPVPMAVAYSVIYVPTIVNLFGFRTYEAPAVNVSPFNDYASYQTDWPWLDYADAVIV